MIYERYQKGKNRRQIAGSSTFTPVKYTTTGLVVFVMSAMEKYKQLS